MKLIDRQQVAGEAYERWMRQYPDDKNGIGAKLKKLGEKPCPDDVDALIGNGSWTATPPCFECGKKMVTVVEIGEDYEYDSNTTWVCSSCLTKALELLKRK